MRSVLLTVDNRLEVLAILQRYRFIPRTTSQPVKVALSYSSHLWLCDKSNHFATGVGIAIAKPDATTLA